MEPEYNNQDHTSALSNFFGYLSICSFTIVFCPQIWENYKRKSVEGVSLSFILIWLLGDVFNVAGAFMHRLLTTVILLGCYFAIMDIIILFQFFIYRQKKHDEIEESSPMLLPRSSSPLSSLEQQQHYHHQTVPGSINSGSTTTTTTRRSTFLSTPVFAAKSTSSTPVVVEASRSLSSSLAGGRDVSGSLAGLYGSLASKASVGSTFLAVGGLMLFLDHHHSQLPSSNHSSPSKVVAINRHAYPPPVGDGDNGGSGGIGGGLSEQEKFLADFMGYLSALLYMAARLPQIMVNFARKSTVGLSLWMFFFSVLGNLCFCLSIIAEWWINFQNDGGAYLWLNFPWLLGAFGTVVFDMIIFFQFWQYQERHHFELLL